MVSGCKILFSYCWLLKGKRIGENWSQAKSPRRCQLRASSVRFRSTDTGWSKNGPPISKPTEEGDWGRWLRWVTGRILKYRLEARRKTLRISLTQVFLWTISHCRLRKPKDIPPSTISSQQQWLRVCWRSFSADAPWPLQKFANGKKAFWITHLFRILGNSQTFGGRIP